ncbi:SusC/RagA family TonB-linked outer membrane protein [Carboxylicivirga linearis]|uniref:TonB-dependent receptor n=1 Tax=Carboxylicivirga linearis TaxID=1628157 RepID=A0ABS5K169_9BACT|nr:TonB-dependent receptor [Carboxylicivirga linearis]MBS2100286.1 TonB-dependent receptor [Carboxylicivirga linearis]
MKKSMNWKFITGSVLLLFLSLFSIETFAQQTNVNGKVTDDKGEPLTGVNIVQKGTTNGTITDINGVFNLVVSQDAVLVFRFIGMKTFETPVNGQSIINVTLQNESIDLDQLIVVGYQSQRKADLTGAVSVVEVDEIMKQGENNPIKALQGRIPGVNVITDGNPSGASTVRIRGIGTLNNNDPLYVIDGVPTKGGMHELNPSDIESIQVLRDASAASIYGSRAGNGVIIITTKQGKDGKTKVNFDTFHTFSQYGEVIDMMNSNQFGQAQWQAMINSGVNPNNNQIGYLYDYEYGNDGSPILNGMKLPKYIDARDGTNTMLTSDTDWFNSITRPGFAQSYNLSISNGTEKSNTFFSLGYYDNTGTVKETRFKRYSARLNSSSKILGDIITIGENLTINNTSELQAPGGVLDLAILSLPVMPLKTVDGDWGSVTSGMRDRDNPARILDANKDNPYNYWRLFGNTFVDIQPIKNLHIKSNFGLDYSNYYQRALIYSFGGRLGSDLTSSKIIQSHSLKWNWTNTMNYDFQIDKSKFSILLGTEMIDHSDINFSTERRTYEVEDPDYMWPSAGVGEMYSTGGATGYKLNSFFGKIDYAYADKYLASATLRRDGSSRFGKENRYATFPAFSVGWRIDQENFMEGTKGVISNLKLRVGWGQTGNQEIDNYANRTLIIANYIGETGAGINTGTAYDINGDNSGLLPSGYQLILRANDEIRWETTTQTNVGVDFGLFNQNLTGSIEFYLKDTEDILVKPPYLGAIGEGGDHWLNGASMENKGVEFSIGYKSKTSFGLSYDITANVSGNRNKITKLPESVVNSYGGNGTTDNILGKPINSYYGYVADGLFQSQEEVDDYVNQTGKGLGRIRYANLNDDDVIDENDRTWIGNPHPDFEYGLNIGLGYKGFDFTAFIQGVYGNEVYNSVKRFTDFWAVDELGSNKGTRVLNAWSPTNTGSDIPALSYSDLNNEKRTSSYYVESGSYLKLRMLQLGYSLPDGVLQKLKMGKARFYISGQNLLTIKSKEFTGLDPENPHLAYPISTSFTLGMNVSF